MDTPYEDYPKNTQFLGVGVFLVAVALFVVPVFLVTEPEENADLEDDDAEETVSPAARRVIKNAFKKGSDNFSTALSPASKASLEQEKELASQIKAGEVEMGEAIAEAA